MSDKVARLANLKKRGGGAANESVVDSWVDLVGYSLIALMWIDRTFLLPLAADALEGSTT